MFAYLSSLRQTEAIVTVRHDLAPGWRLSIADLEWRAVPGGSSHPLSVRDPAEVEGLVLIAPVWQGEPLLLADVASPGPGGPLALQLAAGERAVFVPWPQAGIHGLEPGDWVDLVAVWTRFDAADAYETLTHARVLRLDRSEFGDGGFIAAVPAAAAGEVVAALEHGSLYPVLRPLFEP